MSLCAAGDIPWSRPVDAVLSVVILGGLALGAWLLHRRMSR